MREACWDLQGHQGCRVCPEFLVQKVTKVTRVIRETRVTKGDPGTPADVSALVTLATNQTVGGSKTVSYTHLTLPTKA